MVRHMAVTILALICIASIAGSSSDSKILFVNEVCRHGARAPEKKGYENPAFPNGRGMLTASGMRQQYLLGHQLRNRYVKENEQDTQKLLSTHYDVDEIYVKSTQYLRTIQSAQSQLLGLYPLGSAADLPEDLVENAHPHIKITDDAEIIKKLGKNAIVDGYRPIPVHNYPDDVDSMIAYGDCPFMTQDYLDRMERPEIWKPYDDKYRPLIYKQIAQAFDLNPDDLDFLTVYPLADILWAEDFQGVQNRYNFNKTEFEILKRMQIPALVELLSDDSRNVMVSRMVNPVVELMKSKVGKSYNKTLVKDFDGVKFLLFSSHDYQISQILTFLKPENFELKWIDYASVILYELHQKQSAECNKEAADECFFVKVFFNNDQLKLPGCQSIDCSFDEFIGYIADIGMSYDEMQKVCYQSEVNMKFIDEPHKHSAQN